MEGEEGGGGGDSRKKEVYTWLLGFTSRLGALGRLLNFFFVLVNLDAELEVTLVEVDNLFIIKSMLETVLIAK